MLVLCTAGFMPFDAKLKGFDKSYTLEGVCNVHHDACLALAEIRPCASSIFPYADMEVIRVKLRTCDISNA